MFRANASLLAGILVGLVALKLLVLWLQPRLAFYPLTGVQETPAELGIPFRDLRITTDDGVALHAWWLEHPAPRAQVVFFHGNGGNLSLWIDVIAGLRQRGFSVLAVDYRGYGASGGHPSEEGLYRDADATIRAFAELRKENVPVIYWGRSIGTPVAAHAATRAAPDALVLESPLPDVRSVLQTNPVMWLLGLFSSYRFPTAELVRQTRVPLLVVHGDADTIVPHAAGKRVFDAAPGERKTFVTIPGAGHNDLHVATPSLYWRSIDAFAASLRPAAR